MTLKVIVAVLLIAAVLVCAQAQKPSPAKVTKADAQRVLEIIQGDKAKTQIYCEMAKIGNQLEQINEEADPKKFEELSRKMDELAKRLGPEYGALIDGLQDVDPRSEVGQEISSTLDALDHLCGKSVYDGSAIELGLTPPRHGRPGLKESNQIQ
jgi:hypothetical protein